ncbi:MAG TPA: radical SAM protein, partial [bacterium]|nr:radical SAM protein [bacterium]
AGLWYRRDGKAVATPPRPFIADLDTLPFPAWDLLPMEAYTTPMHLVGGRRVPVMGSRGCPYGCSYCVSPQFWRRQLRWRSPARVVDEMEALYRRFGIRSIHFWDDNLFLDGEYLAGLCRELIARRLPLRWVGLTRASHIVQQQHLLSLVRAAGCLGMELGIETADPEAHRQVGKDESLDQTRQAAELLKQHGLYPMFTYMAFNPGDTLASYYHQAQFIDQILAGCAWAEYFHPLEVPVYVGQFCTPHPGTQLYTEAPRLGTVFAGGWPDYYHHRVNFLPNSLLDDVPRRNACRLCNLDYWLVARAAVSGYYRMIPARASLGLRLRRLAAAANLTRAWWQLTDGRHRVRDILAAVEHRFFAERQDTVSVSAIIVLVLAQRGVLAGTTPVPVRAIDLTRSDYQRRGRWKMLGIRTLALLQRAHLLPRP